MQQSLQRKARTRYSVPYHCPVCTGDEFYGLLRFPEDIERGTPVACPNHTFLDEDGKVQSKYVPLVPVIR